MSDSLNKTSGDLGLAFMKEAALPFDIRLTQAAVAFRRDPDEAQAAMLVDLLVQATEEGTAMDERIDRKLKAADLLETVSGVKCGLSSARDLRSDLVDAMEGLSARQATSLMERITARVEGEKILNYGDRSLSQMVDLFSCAALVVVADRGTSAGCADRLYTLIPAYGDFPGGEHLTGKICDSLYPYLNDDNRFSRLSVLQGIARSDRDSDESLVQNGIVRSAGFATQGAFREASEAFLREAASKGPQGGAALFMFPGF